MIEYSDKLYKRVSAFGKAGIVLGIVSIVVGVAVGIITIVFAAKALSTRKNLID